MEQEFKALKHLQTIDRGITMKAITLKVDTCEHCGAYCLTRNMRDIGNVPYCHQCYTYLDEAGELQTCERCEAVDFYAAMSRFDLCENCFDDLHPQPWGPHVHAY